MARERHRIVQGLGQGDILELRQLTKVWTGPTPGQVRHLNWFKHLSWFLSSRSSSGSRSRRWTGCVSGFLLER